MRNLLFLSISFLCSYPCIHAQNNETSAVALKGETVKYFSEAFIYQHTVYGEEQVVWLYYNPDSREILYIPNDDMIQAVISFPNGDYFGYLTDEIGNKRIIRQHVPEVAEVEYSHPPAFHRLIPRHHLKKKMVTEFQQNEEINSSAIEIEYLKSGEKETVYISGDFSVNSYQIYGFNRLEDDMRLPFTLDYIGILTKKQLAIAIENNPYQTVKLNEHTATVYYFDTKGFE